MFRSISCILRAKVIELMFLCMQIESLGSWISAYLSQVYLWSLLYWHTRKRASTLTAIYSTIFLYTTALWYSILYGRKFLREKTFANFEACGYSRKFSLQKLGVCVASIGSIRNTRKSFLHENLIFLQFAKVFSLERFPLHGTFRIYSTFKTVVPFGLL